MTGRQPDPGADSDAGSGADPGGRRLAEPVRRHRERRERWLATGERPMARNLALIGALGWLVVTPTLLGLFAGRWLDRSLGGPPGGGEGPGIFWTVSLLFAGLVLGCRMAWDRIHRE
ncbi:AtpZ/AtpI family protein [Azospirillum thermophilum]|uniref:ATPase F0F1 n=1 Tax=Azospirillum thermophilum TaxID=2202148 RepID=A0A2S2CUM4_9PROT|nr:AtpZ/AtpI family protein [Azospirillum thermophilum]AWK88186.1 ATPase F0F1 [Azospirillum thermophilum]